MREETLTPELRTCESGISQPERSTYRRMGGCQLPCDLTHVATEQTLKRSLSGLISVDHPLDFGCRLSTVAGLVVAPIVA
jgi:hypothetical protein